jgi:hypothetical protein
LEFGEHRDERRPDLDRPKPLALRRPRVVAVAAALPVDAHDAVVEREVLELDGERFGDAGAGADQKVRKRAVVPRARIEVRLDLI